MTNINIKLQKPALRYEKAYFESLEGKSLDLALLELKFLYETIKNSEELKSFLSHPIVSKEDKKDVLKNIFKDFSNESKNFISLLIDSNRLDCLDEIIIGFENRKNNKENVLEADITLSLDIDEELKNIITKRLETKFKSKMKINFLKDEKIIGGMLIKIKDTVIDLSIKKSLEDFKRI